jgi:intracellular sulfur oxidation DsrE/DsrF family protein
MKLNKISLYSLLVASVLTFSGISHVAQAADNKVVFQVSDADAKKWNLALNNAKNVQQEFGKGNVDVEIVVYGPGIGMLKLESEVGTRVDQAVGDGVKVVACENTMKGQKLTKADMLPSAAYVPGGVIELMKLQKEGWAYIRP